MPIPIRIRIRICRGQWQTFETTKCVGENEKRFYTSSMPQPAANFNGRNFCIFSLSKRFFMLSRVCQMKVTHAHSFIFIFFFFLLPLLGLPNKLMPFYLFFTNTLRAEQSRTQNSVRSWKSRRLECCHPILRVAQVLERKKLYFIKQTKANFYNFLFNANKSKVAATG